MATITEALTLALQHHQVGRLREAERLYHDILRVAPDNPDALHLAGVVAHQTGRHEAAVESISRAIALNPASAEYHVNLAAAYGALNRFDEAAVHCQQAISFNPNTLGAHFNLGKALAEQGQHAAAVGSYRHEIAIAPNRAEVHYNLANALYALGRLDEAVESYTRAVQLRPNYAAAHYNLAKALQDQGKLESAAAAYRRALEVKPDYAAAFNNLGNILQDLGRLDEAVAAFQRSLDLDPQQAQTHNNLGNALKGQGRLVEAAASYRRALQIEPDQTLWELRLASLCPPVIESNEAIDEYRDRLLGEVKRLSARDFTIDLAELSMVGCEPPLELLYDGRDDRPLKEAYAEFFQPRFHRQSPTPNRGGVPRIGFIVTRFHEGIFLRVMSGVLKRLVSEPFELVIACAQTGVERIRSGLQTDAVRILPLPQRFDQMLDAISDARFDVLYHWEIGTDAVNYFLPFFRLAPIQCTSWGLPATSGIAAVDYYLSSTLFEPAEPAEAQEHYTETLICAPSLLTYQERIALPPSPKPREAFGFSADRRLYLCAQNLRKLHPDFDALLAGILRRDERGIVVLVEDHAHHGDQLRRRFAITLADVADRVGFLPQQSLPDYLSLLAAADVLLDPLYFGGGVTAFDAFSLNKPIVTLPWRFRRGRFTAGCYRRMGLSQCIASTAEEYIDTAVALGSDADLRAAVADDLRRASPQLFEDARSIADHADFFHRLLEEARPK